MEVAAVLYHDWEDFTLIAVPGSLMFVGPLEGGPVLSMVAHCPGCKALHGFPFKVVGLPTIGWTWNGNRTEPSLLEAVHHDVAGCGWQGFLRDGVWIPACLTIPEPRGG